MTAALPPREEFRALLNRLLDLVARGVPYVEFLGEMARNLLEFSSCDAMELRVEDGPQSYRCQARWDAEHTFHFATAPRTAGGEGLAPAAEDPDLFEQLCANVVEHRFDPSLPFFTKGGSFWISEAEGLLPITPPNRLQGLRFEGPFRSFAMIRLPCGRKQYGLLQLWSTRPAWFTRDKVEFYESFAPRLGDALAHQRAQWALRERVKELTCLYGIAQADQPGTSLDEVLRHIANLLPPGWQYPEVCAARILLDGHSHETTCFSDGVQRQAADIVIDGEQRGVVEVVYTADRPALDEGPFLKEERSLISEVARQVSLLVQRRQTEEEKAKLQEQLRHADRLATIGQLAAGSAHELNEPLGSILGFAELALGLPGLAEPTARDLSKIVKAAIHAREVIKKLMFFGRQTPPQKTHVNLNAIVRDGVDFIESRCSKEGIILERRLSPGLPTILADPGQLQQVLVNLVVNAVQAMPSGGTLIIETRTDKDHIVLSVKDTGVGMSEEVKKQIFLPFFTTKDVSQGTGLGLCVVHGIVTAHGGSIDVESEVGLGSRFEIRLPRPGPPVPKE